MTDSESNRVTFENDRFTYSASIVLIVIGFLLGASTTSRSIEIDHLAMRDSIDEIQRFLESNWSLILNHQHSIDLTLSMRDPIEAPNDVRSSIGACVYKNHVIRDLIGDYFVNWKWSMDRLTIEVVDDVDRSRIDCGDVTLAKIIDVKSRNWKLCKIRDSGDWIDGRCRSTMYLHQITIQVSRNLTSWVLHGGKCEMEWRKLPLYGEASMRRLEASPRILVCNTHPMKTRSKVTESEGLDWRTGMRLTRATLILSGIFLTLMSLL